MSDIADNCRRYHHIMARIEAAALRAGRDPRSIQLVAVTKTVSADRIRAAAACGVRQIGENRLQEALAKKPLLADLDLTWRFIGRLQSNKARKAAQSFDRIDSVERIDIAEKLDQAAAGPLPVMIEVQLHEEPNKSGASVDELPQLVDAIRHCRNLELQGLMAIPPFFDDPEQVRPYFRRLRELAVQYELTELSMGMTHDFEVAVEEGATMVRIGTGLFGRRG